MPFRSKAQQRFMFARHPAIAKRWADTYGVPSSLPEHVKDEHVGDAPKRRARLRKRKLDAMRRRGRAHTAG